MSNLRLSFFSFTAKYIIKVGYMSVPYWCKFAHFCDRITKFPSKLFQ